MTGRERLEGADALSAALAAGRPVGLVMVHRGDLVDAEPQALQTAVELKIPVKRVSDAVLRRFSGDSRAPARVLSVAGAPPQASLHELMRRAGDVWLLSGLAYPGNIGCAVRTLEVAGAAGVAIDTDLPPAGRRAALRASMRADRLYPVLWQTGERVIAAARAADRAVVAVETGGEELADAEPLPSHALIVLGGERDGLPDATLRISDRVVRLPVRGFIPSYNVQAAAAMVAALRLRRG